MTFIGECIDTKSVAYGPTSIDSSLGYNDVEIDDLRLPFVDDSKDDVVNDSKQAYEIDASGKEKANQRDGRNCRRHKLAATGADDVWRRVSGYESR